MTDGLDYCVHLLPIDLVHKPFFLGGSDRTDVALILPVRIRRGLR